ncbi:Protein SEC13 like protein [Myotis davidii]|uniref:Protein SEC13 homolog n=1 Tax=Myotis davidii TaxID=225400 RepID=L5MDW9_MYODS|nr:Protein SEC13 like protein [Myotis davidii]
MGHEAPVWQVAWAHPMYGNILASCSYDRKVIFWKEENKTWEKTHEHTGHDSSVNSVCWAPQDYGLILACGSSDGAISLLTYTGEGQWEVKIMFTLLASMPQLGPWCCTRKPHRPDIRTETQLQ